MELKYVSFQCNECLTLIFLRWFLHLINYVSSVWKLLNGEILFYSEISQISKKKLKKLYKTKENAEYDKADLVLYEEVTRMPPFKRKTLVLVGVQGVGRRTLKNRLINSDQTKFGSVIPRKYLLKEKNNMFYSEKPKISFDETL